MTRSHPARTSNAGNLKTVVTGLQDGLLGRETSQPFADGDASIAGTPDTHTQRSAQEDLWTGGGGADVGDAHTWPTRGYPASKRTVGRWRHKRE